MQLRTLFPVLGPALRHRSRALLALTALAATPLHSATSEPADSLTATVTGLRSAKGQVIACLTGRAQGFPRCDRDLDAIAARAGAASQVELDFGRVPPGRYAISLFHDENGNGKLDTRLGIPREGYGFSRDAPVRLGPPSFRAAAFPVERSGQHQTIRMRYIF